MQRSDCSFCFELFFFSMCEITLTDLSQQYSYSLSLKSFPIDINYHNLCGGIWYCFQTFLHFSELFFRQPFNFVNWGYDETIGIIRKYKFNQIFKLQI